MSNPPTGTDAFLLGGVARTVHGPTADALAWRIPADQVFVMGDGRANSVDSWPFGPIPIVSIVGRAVYRCRHPAVRARLFALVKSTSCGRTCESLTNRHSDDAGS